jgi:hypothetical protein
MCHTIIWNWLILLTLRCTLRCHKRKQKFAGTKCTEILQFKMLNLCTSSCIYWMSFQYWRKVVLKLDFDSASARNQQSTVWHCPDSKTTSLCFYSLMAHRQSLTWLFWDKSYDLITTLEVRGPNITPPRRFLLNKMTNLHILNN